MIVCDFHIVRDSISPDEANTPLVIYPNDVLSRPVATKFFQTVCRRNSEVIERRGFVEHAQLTQGYLLDVIWQLSC